jgi:hypothetical protein
MKGRIKIDLSEVIEELALSKKQTEKMCKAVLSGVSQEIANNWRQLASKELKSSRADYIRGIVVIEEGRLTNAIILKGAFNNKMESGSAPWDMKKFFEKSPKAKRTKNGGWYLRIPFRFSTPDALGENSAFSNSMPKEVYDVAKNLTPEKTTLGGTRLQKGKGMTRDEIPVAFRDVITRKGRDGFEDYTHKSSIYEGMFRTERMKSNGQRESTYMTIRTASSNSDPASWIHPGFKPLNLADKAQTMTDVDMIVNNIVDKFIANL